MNHPTLISHPSNLHADRTSRDLSQPQRRLVRLLQQVRYGRVHRLCVRAGQPVLDREVTWTRTIKVIGENDPHPASSREDFALPKEVIAFFGLLASMGDGELTNLEVRNGIPFSFERSGCFDN